MKLTATRQTLAALAILTSGAAYFVCTDRSPPPTRNPPREIIRDPAAPDPLRLALIARLQRIPPAGARNLFAFVAPRPTPDTHRNSPSPSVTSFGAATVKERSSDLTFYGYIAAHTRPLRAFFSDGSEIYIKSEGEFIAARYKVGHLDQAAAILEDTLGNTRYTLTLDPS